ncbi:MAG: formyltetrahydrofolate deformylase [Verrucomicrobia bacterium]|nr:formyltetrahydrofolate deformylase [Kiritimatiellia bacterium]MCP5487649.1 formyltetrahydrofolate deformylase [Verrucomicrobiota bacterium]
MNSTSAILLVHCPDRRGINAAITKFVADHQGNILDYDQHVDDEAGIYFARIEWDMEGFALTREQIVLAFTPLAQGYDITWQLYFSDTTPRMALMVSKLPHCLYDLLARWQTGELDVEIPLIVSNHPDLEPVAQRFGIDFHHIPVSAQTKPQQEAKQIALLKDYKADFVVLARYMQILSGDFVRHYPNRIINIHHSFLPAFAGAKPYHAAHERGVKIIGATSHYVTEDLDEGPILAQDVMTVSHKDAVTDLVRKGKDLEKIVLAHAVWLHRNRKILVYGNRTVIFE